jgi:hypothetical protein
MALLRAILQVVVGEERVEQEDNRKRRGKMDGDVETISNLPNENKKWQNLVVTAVSACVK